jgi:hypothetical protein
MLNYSLMRGKLRSFDRALRICRLVRANTHFFEPQIIINYVPDAETWKGQKFVRFAGVMCNWWYLWIGLNKLKLN